MADVAQTTRPAHLVCANALPTMNSGPYTPVDLSTSESHKGANASISVTVKLSKVSIEPFINGGTQIQNLYHPRDAGDNCHPPANFTV